MNEINAIVSRFAKTFSMRANPNFATRCIRVGQDPEIDSGAVSPAIQLTSTYKQNSPGKPIGKFDYTRAGNPTVDRLELNLAALENGKYGIAFSSGCGAMNAILSNLNAGDHVVCVDDVYGGTNRLLNRVFNRFGIQVTMADLSEPSNLHKHLKSNTKLLIVETPTNPLLKIIDIEALTKIAREKGITSVVDNTFASPLLQTPLDLGADIVLHSATKYIGGHSDLIAGALITNSSELNEKLRFNLLSIGSCIGPFEAWMLLRSVKTLEPRMKAHCYNAHIIANYLAEHPKIKRVYFPGLESHANHKVSVKQMRAGGGMVTFELKGSEQYTLDFIKKLKLFTLAESLGGVETLLNVPAKMTHLSVPKDQRDRLGITDSLIRISLGIENVEDLIGDLMQALD